MRVAPAVQQRIYEESRLEEGLWARRSIEIRPPDLLAATTPGMTQHDLPFCRWSELLTIFPGVQHIVKVQAYSLRSHLHDGKAEVSGKVPLAGGGTLGRSVAALALAGGTLYHLLEPSAREVFLVMGVAGKIDMDVALT